MRSRYSAYVMQLEPYLLATWHSRSRPPAVAFTPAIKWLGLSIKAARDTGADAAEVEFIARCRSAGACAVRLHERSRFLREEGRWYYVDGDPLP